MTTPEYIKLCDYMDSFVKAYNPCEIEIKDGITYCIDYPNGKDALCCGPSKYENPVPPFDKTCEFFNCGCTIKNITCKMWLCQKAWENLYDKMPKEYLITYIMAVQSVVMVTSIVKPRSNEIKFEV